MKWLPDLLLFGPILFVGAFGWVASALSLRSSQRFREAMLRDARRPNPAPVLSGPAE